ncbi:MAG: hypothetical protein ACI9NC_003357, partial [Verrucomicrobiales bacterium]
ANRESLGRSGEDDPLWRDFEWHGSDRSACLEVEDPYLLLLLLFACDEKQVGFQRVECEAVDLARFEGPVSK